MSTGSISIVQWLVESIGKNTWTRRGLGLTSSWTHCTRHMRFANKALHPLAGGTAQGCSLVHKNWWMLRRFGFFVIFWWINAMYVGQFFGDIIWWMFKWNRPNVLAKFRILARWNRQKETLGDIFPYVTIEPNIKTPWKNTSSSLSRTVPRVNFHCGNRTVWAMKASRQLRPPRMWTKKGL